MRLNSKLTYAFSGCLAIAVHALVVYGLWYLKDDNISLIDTAQSPRSLSTMLVDLQYKPIEPVRAKLLVEAPIRAKKVADKPKKTKKKIKNIKIVKKQVVPLKKKPIAKAKKKKDVIATEVKTTTVKKIKKKPTIPIKKLVTKPESQNNLLTTQVTTTLTGEPTPREEKLARVFQKRIQKQIEQNWRKPLNVQLQDIASLEVLIRLKLDHEGNLLQATVERSSGNDPFDRSALIAVKKVKRYKVPSDRRTFDIYFRNLLINYTL